MLSFLGKDVRVQFLSMSEQIVYFITIFQVPYTGVWKWLPMEVKRDIAALL